MSSGSNSSITPIPRDIAHSKLRRHMEQVAVSAGGGRADVLDTAGRARMAMFRTDARLHHAPIMLSEVHQFALAIRIRMTQADRISEARHWESTGR
jgi:hypothetical protein